jgi:plastocyanin
MREAAALLEKAADALARGNRSFAEQLFSSAELLVGPEVLAELAARFRAGAPPRVNTPLKVVPDAGAQPLVAGSSDTDEPEAKPEKGALSGTVTIDGKSGSGFGVVTLEPMSGKFRKRVPKQRVMEQRDREFSPRVLAVPVGSTVSFPNYDGTFHNVFSVSESKPFDLGLYKGGQARDVTFEAEGVVRLGCNLHANMQAWVVVVAAPHYAITDKDGTFKFGSLAPGKYKLRAWNERSQTPVEQEIVVKAGANQVAVGVKGDAPEGPPPDKFGVARGKK